ncbi:MAG: YkgJ family cysteine cluster protein [Pirellulaceae bacterium]|jgi:hypothetical protein|nr:YkgJ family cysteine cluster protein [Pirellulaceae bacterium]
MTKATGNDQPWYRDGLRFECSQCGECCTGGPGYVWVNKAEIAAMAATIGETDIAAFELKYVRKIGVRKSLKEFANYDCVFLDERRRCLVYNDRPRQCRTWPFWDSNLRSAESWRQTCEVCPGAGNGELYQIEHIESQRRVFHI